MAKQNIFDNEEFFAGYKKLRDQEVNANVLFEIPALNSLLPDMTGLRVLDLGCGFGEHCVEYVKKGASKVVGTDISEKMLEVARAENSDPRITYKLLPMENLDQLDEEFDLVISSLAFHYIEDYKGVVSNVSRLLSDKGLFIFSQEHPLATSYTGDMDRWTRDENGVKLYVNLRYYGVEGERKSTWFVDGIQKYHRTFSTVMNTLFEAGFNVEKIIEPIPDEAMIEKYPTEYDLLHKPDFLLVRARKA